MTEKDYGTLMCWGSNEVGLQRHPCIYQVVPAGEPDPPHNCTISNQTSAFLEIDCEQGFDGGLPQFFVMEVYDSSSQILKYNVSSDAPHFVVDGLIPGSQLIISMYAANGKGKSSNLVFQASTLRLPERITDAGTGIIYSYAVSRIFHDLYICLLFSETIVGAIQNHASIRSPHWRSRCVGINSIDDSVRNEIQRFCYETQEQQQWEQRRSNVSIWSLVGWHERQSSFEIRYG
jgi:hypothetical protein